MTPDDVKVAFEAWNTAALQAAVDYADGDERVRRIFVYTLLDGHSIEAAWFFDTTDGFVGAKKLAEVLGVAEESNVSLGRGCRGERMAFMRALIDAGVEIPARIVTDYDPHAGRMAAAWEYADDVLTGPDDTAGRARDRWIVAHGGQAILS